MSLAGSYKITFVLPRATIENIITFIPTERKDKDGYVLEGNLDTGGQGAIEFSAGYYKGDYFAVNLSVGPGDLAFTGSVQGDGLSGVVLIDNCPDKLEGTRV